MILGDWRLRPAKVRWRDPGAPKTWESLGLQFFLWRRGCEDAPVRCRLSVNSWSENAS
jgi:hypothetical protein